MKERDFSIQESIKNDLKSKIVLLSGPRQVGKTTLSKNLITPYEYINYDIPEDRILLSERSWKKDTNLVIFDEIHKMKNWKSYLKAI